MHANADLHIHSPFSMAVSPAMTPASLIEACVRKGIQVLGSGDALHPVWRAAWKEFTGEPGVIVVPTTEIEGPGRVHHLVLMESFEQFAELATLLEPYAKGIRTNGRPRVDLPAGEIGAFVHDLGGAIGPSHAFTPWTSLYAYFDRLTDCYGTEPVDFLELGLSADSSYGAAIPELYDIPFLSNSDAHSTDPAKCGREYTSLDIPGLTVKAAIESVVSGRIVMNAGFFPEEGKYNRTACSRCYEQYSLEEAVETGWRCPKDGGRIKKGVFDRARELSTGPVRPRPPYLHIIPLTEIIQKCLGVGSPRTKKVLAIYTRMLESFGNEINVLTGSPIEEIAEIDKGVACAIDSFRIGRVKLIPGGGGLYGSFEIL
ncbi:MAG: endonuclease Q family protein [Methanoregulaceae archaeon]|nr:endonuclease Q family protein [Methanoregulaceae archaeon]